MISTVDVYRSLSRGEYDNDFTFLQCNKSFPTKEVAGRNILYRYRHKQYSGEYSHNKYLMVRQNDKEMEIPYKALSCNYFRLITNKMTDLVFNNDITIKTGDIERDKDVQSLIEELNFVDSIRKSFKKLTIYGDACLKTYTSGVSPFNPTNCFKLVDPSDINNIRAYVLYEYLYDVDFNNVKKINYVRFEIHFIGKIYECVRQYNGGTLGYNVEYIYRDRVISKDGNWYDTGLNDYMIQWLSINQESDGVYGESLYLDIEDLVYALEQRLSVNQHLLDNSMSPVLAISGSLLTPPDKLTGERRLKLINGQFLATAQTDKIDAKVLELNYNLDQSNSFIEILKEQLYELSEMGKTFLTGSYTGNISEESLNNIVKSAIDKGNRLITEAYTAYRDSLYVLCKLNNIELKKSDINIDFNIGRTDDDKQVADVSTILVTNKILSKQTVREKYYGYNKEQSLEEDRQIDAENSQHKDNIDNQIDNLVNDINETETQSTKEDKTNEAR